MVVAIGAVSIVAICLSVAMNSLMPAGCPECGGSLIDPLTVVVYEFPRTESGEWCEATFCGKCALSP